MESVALYIFLAGIVGLFVLDHRAGGKTSKALWIPVLWLSLAGSRSASEWINLAPPALDSPDQLLEGSPVDRAVYAAILAIGIVILVGRGRRLQSLLRSNLPIVLFFLYCMASVAWSDFPLVALKRLTKGLADVVMVMIVLTDSDRELAIKRFFGWTAFLLVPLSILLIKYYPVYGRHYTRWTWTPQFTGVTTNKNMLGMVCLVVGIACVWHFLAPVPEAQRLQHRRRRLVYSVVLAMVLWLLWRADSMTSLSCFLLASGLMILTSRRAIARKSWLVHTIAAGIVGLATTTLFLDAGAGILESMGRDPTLTDRTNVWSLVLQVAGNPILGTGYESFWLGERLQTIWSVYWWRPNEAHNGYLEVFLNLGWIGIILLAAVTARGYRNAVRAVRRQAQHGGMVLAYLVVGLIYSFTEAGFRMMSPVWVGFLLAAMVPPAAAAVQASRVVPEEAGAVAADASPAWCEELV